MPHSVSPEAPPVEDSILPDAPANPLVEDAGSENGGDDSAEIVTDVPARPQKSNVTLKPEDLFMTDDEDDEEFPMSSAPSGEGKVDGSSPPAVSM